MFSFNLEYISPDSVSTDFPCFLSSHLKHCPHPKTVKWEGSWVSYVVLHSPMNSSAIWTPTSLVCYSITWTIILTPRLLSEKGPSGAAWDLPKSQARAGNGQGTQGESCKGASKDGFIMWLQHAMSIYRISSIGPSTATLVVSYTVLHSPTNLSVLWTLTSLVCYSPGSLSSPQDCQSSWYHHQHSYWASVSSPLWVCSPPITSLLCVIDTLPYKLMLKSCVNTNQQLLSQL